MGIKEYLILDKKINMVEFRSVIEMLILIKILDPVK